MEYYMNNVLEDVNELKEIIFNSKEYKEYKKYLDALENNDEVNKLIKKITTLQKKVVRNEDLNKEKELEELYNELNSINVYKKYIESSKRLNKILTEVQMNFNDFFNRLVS